VSNYVESFALRTHGTTRGSKSPHNEVPEDVCFFPSGDGSFGGEGRALWGMRADLRHSSGWKPYGKMCVRHRLELKDGKKYGTITRQTKRRGLFTGEW